MERETKADIGQKNNKILTLDIDIETASSENLKNVGVYKYSEDPMFKILLFSYAVNGGDVVTVDIASGEKIPEEIIDGILDENVEKRAHNAAFERVCISRYLHTIGKLDEATPFLSPKSWRCSMVFAATLGFPQSLEDLGRFLEIEKQKLPKGKKFIALFCDCKAPKKPSDFPKEWTSFKDYNKGDVEAEMEIWNILENFDTPPRLWEEYEMDQEINDRGIAVDLELIKKALEINSRYESDASTEFSEITGITEKVRSQQKMSAWLLANDIQTDDLKKDTVQNLVDTIKNQAVVRALRLYQALRKSSLKKYDSINNMMCKDGRIRGVLKFYGATHTGRWAGKGVQPQNLPKGSMNATELDAARNTLMEGNYEKIMGMCDGMVPDLLAQLIRTAFIPSAGNKFIVADYAAIEARVLAWLAGEEWRLKAFADGQDIYCASASRMFHKNVVKNGENGELRAKGKVAELALGYQGGTGALIRMGALKMGLKEEELPELIDSWRKANPKIENFWWEVNKAVLQAVKHKKATIINNRICIFCPDDDFLCIELPSGRKLSYPHPTIGINDFGKECIIYTDFSEKKTEEIYGYGGKFSENIAQATARDILCNAMSNLADEGYKIVLHIHDEVIIEAPQDVTLPTICGFMAKSPDWAPDLPLRADGFESPYYRKD